MLRQILVSLLILVAAGVGYVAFVPGSAEVLARWGIDLPFSITAGAATGEAPSPTSTEGRPRGDGPAAGPGGGRPGGGGGRGGFGGNRTPTVVVAPVTSAVINDSLSAIGEGAAARSAIVGAPSGGMLVELAVAPGDRVAAGDIIGHLDSEAEQIALDKAKLAVEDARSTLSRTTELANANSISTAQLASVQLAASNAELELRNAQLALERRSIVAPIAGTVGLLQVTPGNHVSAQTEVTTIEDISEIIVSFHVPERYVSSVRAGMAVKASAVALTAQVFEGVVSAVDNRIDPASRTLQVQARLPNADGALRAGMSFAVSLSFPGESFPAVDPLSLQWSSDGAYVWKYAAGKVEKAMVQVVQRNSDGVLVRGEIAEGDEVVTEGVLQLNAGGDVNLLGAAPDPQASGGGAPDEGSRRRQGAGEPATGRPAAAAPGG